MMRLLRPLIQILDVAKNSLCLHPLQCRLLRSAQLCCWNSTRLTRFVAPFQQLDSACSVLLQYSAAARALPLRDGRSFSVQNVSVYVQSLSWTVLHRYCFNKRLKKVWNEVVQKETQLTTVLTVKIQSVWLLPTYSRWNHLLYLSHFWPVWA